MLDNCTLCIYLKFHCKGPVYNIMSEILSKHFFKKSNKIWCKSTLKRFYDYNDYWRNLEEKLWYMHHLFMWIWFMSLYFIQNWQVKSTVVWKVYFNSKIGSKVARVFVQNFLLIEKWQDGQNSILVPGERNDRKHTVTSKVP